MSYEIIQEIKWWQEELIVIQRYLYGNILVKKIPISLRDKEKLREEMIIYSQEAPASFHNWGCVLPPFEAAEMCAIISPFCIMNIFNRNS